MIKTSRVQILAVDYQQFQYFYRQKAGLAREGTNQLILPPNKCQ
jgi:hypothetical protein